MRLVRIFLFFCGYAHLLLPWKGFQMLTRTLRLGHKSGVQSKAQILLSNSVCLKIAPDNFLLPSSPLEKDLYSKERFSLIYIDFYHSPNLRFLLCCLFRTQVSKNIVALLQWRPCIYGKMFIAEIKLKNEKDIHRIRFECCFWNVSTGFINQINILTSSLYT